MKSMFLFAVTLPLLYMLLIKTLVSPTARIAPVSLWKNVSMLQLPFLLLGLLAFRFLASKAAASFSVPLMLLYGAFASALPLLIFLGVSRLLLSFPSRETSPVVFMGACIVQFWFSLGSLLIAYDFFTYKEYFLFPAFQLALTHTYLLCVPRRGSSALIQPAFRLPAFIAVFSLMAAGALASIVFAFYARPLLALFFAADPVLAAAFFMLQYCKGVKNRASLRA